MEGHFTKQHPEVTKVEATFDGTGCTIPKRHSDKTCTLAYTVHSGFEGYWVSLPLGPRAKITGGLPEHTYPSGKHIITVDL